MNKTNPIEAKAFIGNQQPNAKMFERKPIPQVSLIAVQSRCVKIETDKSLPVIEAYLNAINKMVKFTLGAALLAVCVDYKNKANKPKKRKA